MNLPLDAALGYASWGIPVYPVHWPTRGGRGPRLLLPTRPSV
jgi:hypothetical protein